MRFSAEGGSPAKRRRDKLVTEEPLEIRAGGPGEEPVSVAVTMRTPGHDIELAAGFMQGQGLLNGGLAGISTCESDSTPLEDRGNTVRVRLNAPLDHSRLRRQIEVSSSCGICGRTTLQELAQRISPLASGPTLHATTVSELPPRLRQSQQLFEKTGGLHAAALFDAHGQVLVTREDVGRHNALDKALGWQLLNHPANPPAQIAMLSGRVSYELVQKAAAARIPIVCAISAPSSLAVETAEALNMTLIGFIRDDGFNVYCGKERLAI